MTPSLSCVAPSVFPQKLTMMMLLLLLLALPCLANDDAQLTTAAASVSLCEG
jgi:hypothetical protein